MSIRTKLILGFLALAMFSLIVGIFSIVNMGKINSQTDRMYNRELWVFASKGKCISHLYRQKRKEFPACRN